MGEISVGRVLTLECNCGKHYFRASDRRWMEYHQSGPREMTHLPKCIIDQALEIARKAEAS